MIERLHYLALPKVEESPRSVLLRTVTHNGYRSITQLTTRFRIQGIPPLSLQTGVAPLITELLREAGEYKDQFRRAFYVQEKGVSKASPVRILGTKAPVSAILGYGHKVCPQCLLEEHLRAIQDFEWVDVCPYHEIQYIPSCPKCEKPFRWTYMQLSRCACGHELNPYELPQIKGDPYGARTLLEYLRKGDEKQIQRLQHVLEALKFDSRSDAAERIDTFNQAALICDSPNEGIKGRLENMQYKHPGLPVRALLAPFLAIRDEKIRIHANEVLLSCSPALTCGCRNCSCSDESFSDQEIRVALGISSETLAGLVRNRYLDKRKVGKRGVKYPYQSLCSLYSKFPIAKLNLKNKKKAVSICPSNAFGVALSDKLDQLQSGNLILVEADARRPLSQYLVIPNQDGRPSPERKVVAPEGYMTVQDVADRLDIYPDAVRRSLKAGYISTAIIIGRSNSVFISEKNVCEFDKEFVFIGPLAKQFNAKITAFSAQLATVGILPVSGPGIDGGLVALYRREDLVGHDLQKVAAMPKFRTRAGRKKGDPKRYDTDKWLRAVEVGSLLEISVQHLPILKDYGLLEDGIPPGREADNTRFFTAESADVAKKWFDRARRVAEVAKDENSTSRQIDLRFIQSGHVKPLYIGTWTLISATDMKRIREHRKLYCTCSEAAAHIGAHNRHFNNMIKLGKISPVPAEESGVDSIILLRWSDIKK